MDENNTLEIENDTTKRLRFYSHARGLDWQVRRVVTLVPLRPRRPAGDLYVVAVDGQRLKTPFRLGATYAEARLETLRRLDEEYLQALSEQL